MNKINVLKNLFKDSELLSKQVIAYIKGGAIINPVALANASAVGIAMSAANSASDAVADDKRRQRPGGGVSTL